MTEIWFPHFEILAKSKILPYKIGGGISRLEISAKSKQGVRHLRKFVSLISQEILAKSKKMDEPYKIVRIYRGGKKKIFATVKDN